jgi:7-cyano-7-deazaguanine synthase
MGLVVLVSGGVDSTVISVLAARNNVATHPLFIDYGQLCVEREWSACLYVHKKHALPMPIRMGLGGFGRLIPSGLTDSSRDVVEDAFLPCRNLLFAVCGASYAYSQNADCVALGLLDESAAIFPDQTREFLEAAEEMIHTATGRSIRVVAPLLSVSKAEVLAMAASLGVLGTYSCHRGTAVPCGQCISCLEKIRASKLMG